VLAVKLDEITRIWHLEGCPTGFVDIQIGNGLTKYLNKDKNKNNNNKKSEKSNLSVAGCDKN
jgi:hypothetical protein